MKKIMVIGDSATGKSTFAQKLGGQLSIPVYHLDEIMDKWGREDRSLIGEKINDLVSTPQWVMDGNAFTKDPDGRIDNCDMAFVFDMSRTKTLYNHVARYIKIKSGTEQRTGSTNTSLNLRYFIPYIFIKFPARKKCAISKLKKRNVTVVRFSSYHHADEWLHNNN